MKTSEQTYTTFDIQKKLNIKIDRLKDWMNRGFIEPSVQKATGQGSKNLFSLYDLYLLMLFKYLIERGFSRKDAADRIYRIRILYWSILKKKPDCNIHESLIETPKDYNTIKERKRIISSNYLVLPKYDVDAHPLRGIMYVDDLDSIGHGLNLKTFYLMN